MPKHLRGGQPQVPLDHPVAVACVLGDPQRSQDAELGDGVEELLVQADILRTLPGCAVSSSMAIIGRPDTAARAGRSRRMPSAAARRAARLADLLPAAETGEPASA